MVSISNNRIEGAVDSILPTGGALHNPRYIVCHYTAGGSISGSLQTLKDNGTSYHVLIDRDGTIHQVAPFNRRAAHAGVSNWKGVDGLNDHAIGISLANYGGFLRKLPNGVWRAPGGKELQPAEVLEAEHHLGLTNVTGWERFKPTQLVAMLEVIKAIKAAFPTVADAMGHDEIAMGRRDDPGPDFPWSDVHSIFPDRSLDLGPVVKVHSPSDGFASLRKKRSASSIEVERLPHGTKVHARSVAYVFVTNDKGHKVAVKGSWVSVAKEGSMNHAGFVSRSLLRPDPG